MTSLLRLAPTPLWTRILAAVCLILTGSAAGRAADEKESTLTKVGQAAPTFTVTALNGKTVRPVRHEGQGAARDLSSSPNW